jgi:uncharacterized damage-inducible protein DinB
MTTSAELLTDGFNRIQEGIRQALEGLGPQDVLYRPDPESNTIGWLVWHMTRVQDDHIADVAGHKQVWHEAGWVDRFGLPFDADATGFGQNSLDVGAVQPKSVDLLTGYHDDVHAKTIEYVSALSDRDLEKVIDDSWDPPVTLGTRLVSVVSDDLQHLGQVGYVRGLLERSR